jgi:hypothetical protein
VGFFFINSQRLGVDVSRRRALVADAFAQDCLACATAIFFNSPEVGSGHGLAGRTGHGLAGRTGHGLAGRTGHGLAGRTGHGLAEAVVVCRSTVACGVMCVGVDMLILAPLANAWGNDLRFCE